MPVYLRELSVAQLETTRLYHWQRVEKGRSDAVKERNRKRIKAIDVELERRRQARSEQR
jgi:hypothetical protein